MLLNQGQLEKVKLRARMQGKIETERERMNREMSRRVRAKETEFKTKMWQTDEKLRTLRDIVNDKWAAPLTGGPDDKPPLKKASRFDDKNAAARSRQPRSVSPPPIITSIAFCFSRAFRWPIRVTDDLVPRAVTHGSSTIHRAT